MEYSDDAAAEVDSVVKDAETLLSARFGGTPVLSDPEVLTGQSNALVVRVRVATNPFMQERTVVVKQIPTMTEGVDPADCQTCDQVRVGVCPVLAEERLPVQVTSPDSYTPEPSSSEGVQETCSFTVNPKIATPHVATASTSLLGSGNHVLADLGKRLT